MIIFFGLYLAKVIGTNVLPKEPVPPVINIDDLDSIYKFRLDACDLFEGIFKF